MPHTLASRVALALAVAFGLSTQPLAQCALEKLTASDGEFDDLLGLSVAQDESHIVLGAPLDDASGLNSGSAYVYEQVDGRWIQTAKLVPPSSPSFSNFGMSVAVQSGTILVGAFYIHPTASGGAVFVYELLNGSWVQTDLLQPSQGSPYDMFGHAVAIRNELVAVGAQLDNGGSDYLGAVWLFERTNGTWNEAAKLQPTNGHPFDRFGQSVAIAANTIAVGAPFVDGLTANSGGAYVFERSGGVWTQTAKVGPVATFVDAQFGSAIAVTPSRLLVGARLDHAPGFWSGSAYLFQKQGTDWVLERKLTPSDGKPEDQFGSAVFIEGRTALISSYRSDHVGGDGGSVYAYQLQPGGWTETSLMTPPDGSKDDLFGISLKLVGDRILVGANGDDDRGERSGSAYVWSLNGLNCPDLLAMPDVIDLHAGDAQSTGWTLVPSRRVDCTGASARPPETRPV